ncbi:NAD-glutamate dehydrogenase [Paenarthrobacter nitroguajacolicus]|uniref:NAD-glutamate dehydrogenase n=1 Tax=Paenarthrobacter nitroguajacolicus TaxID=211146 RepID=UPI00248C1545|nr:NAD-glutamate dehydrogenase [Paenarthrobacter nitroguajacolicus]MDI2034175.1 NAD-specific glutamate dehydrogenase [Paenarthrobacter nitroguajacolicus]
MSTEQGMEAHTLPEHFVAHYYAEASPEDREFYGAGVLEARAAAHFEAARTRGAESWVGALPDAGATVVGVACKDSPFVVDSILAEVTRRGLGIRFVVHPRFATQRGEDGELRELRPASSTLDAGTESWIAVELRDLLTQQQLGQLLNAIRQVLADVAAATADWAAMRDRLNQVAAALPGNGKARNLLEWLRSNHFVFIGYRQYILERGEPEDRLTAIDGTGLGVLRKRADTRAEFRVLTGTARDSAREPIAAIVTKARSRSTIHRDAHLDYIGIKTFDSEGQVTGEHRFLGLFTSSVYTGPVDGIPLVAETITAVMERSGLDPASHSGRQLMAILETYPRDELFQIGVEELLQIAGSIMRMQERRRSSAFLRQDAFGRFVTVLVYLPRDRYNTAVRQRIESELRGTFDAVDIEHEARVSSSALARIFFTVWTSTETPGDIHAKTVEQRVNRAIRSWPEGVLDALRSRHPAAVAEALVKRWSEAFPPEYQVRYSVEDAAADIDWFEDLSADDSTTAARLAVRREGENCSDPDLRIRLYLRQAESLSRLLPYFEHLGLAVHEERPYEVVDSQGVAAHLYDLLVSAPAESGSPEAWDLLPAAFRAVLGGEAESDLLNSLVLQQGFDWRIIALLRSYVKYLRQLGTQHSFEFIASTLQSHPGATKSLVGLFSAKFDPNLPNDRAVFLDSADATVAAAMDDVATMDAAFVVGALASLIRATVRTNFYQGHPHISLKLDPSGLDLLPSPRPAHEVWVYSPRVEGVHLRFGLTARGGLRWSDRQEDFRTEVLGLVKAQTVKNSVIVPDGAKGGFYAKVVAGITDRARQLTAGQECYRIFIRGLLDVTDNIRFVNGERQVVAPPNVVRYDGDDSYLVVAADKGTASFSDLANEVAAGYRYWLGDAFASGGSVGYDHKSMGITARGAWESAKIHFSELGLDPRTTDFTVTGIGDMSGDVFGNGMLLSQHVQLVAAFDHRHIFLDPKPDAASSFTERARLFALPRSSWADYDASLISDGGGVWPRTARAIPIHPAVRAALGLDPAVESMSPTALLQAILKAPVDLLYNGGIGTYVKASTESHADAGDRANDSIRVNGNQVRARIVVEGGNLGVTQAGRVEAALAGVLINTDAIDNSAGVDCSDHEVNIKILVDQSIREGKLSAAERTPFLEALTDEIAELVLTDNVAQNVLLLTDRRFPPASFPNYERLMQFLEGRGELDRNLEFLPSTRVLEDRIEQGKGLTSPELSVLAAYAKNTLASSIRTTPLLEDPYLVKFLKGYFPDPVVAKLDEGTERHPLRDDIIATVLANDAINIGGVTSVFRLMEETSVDEAAAVKAFVIASELFGLRDLSIGLVHQCADLPAEKWSRIYLDIRRVLDRTMRWFTQYNHQLPIGECINLYRPVVEALRWQLPELLMGAEKEDVAALEDSAHTWGLPFEVGRMWAELREAFTLLDIAKVQQVTGQSLESIAPVYFTVRDRFRIEALLGRVDELPRSTKWQAMARASLRDDVSAVVPELTVAVLGLDGLTDGADRISAWEQLHHARLNESERLLELAPANSFEALSAYLGTLRKAGRA